MPLKSYDDLPDSSLKLLVIGVGSIGERHLRCFQTLDGVELGICETRPELLHSIAERYGIAHCFESLEDALDRFQPHAAVIATPAPTHIPVALQLAAHGVHMLIEKPLAITEDGIAELQQVVRDRQLVANMAYVYRAHPALWSMKQAIAKGSFGIPVEVIATAGQHFPTFRPAYRDIYYARHASGGGAIQDALTHVINAAEWLVGPASMVLGDARHQVLEGVDVEDTVHVFARHRHQGGNVVMAAYSLNQHQQPNEMTLTVVCTRGTARFEMHNHRWCWMTEPCGSWFEEKVAIKDRDTVFIRQAESFIGTLRAGKPGLCSLDEGVQTLLTMRSIIASAAEIPWRHVKRI